LNERLLTDCVAASVTVPAVPLNTPSPPAVHPVSTTPLYQRGDASHVPLPPRFAPVLMLFPTALPSASQYNDAIARARKHATTATAMALLLTSQIYPTNGMYQVVIESRKRSMESNFA